MSGTNIRKVKIFRECELQNTKEVMCESKIVVVMSRRLPKKIGIVNKLLTHGGGGNTPSNSHVRVCVDGFHHHLLKHLRCRHRNHVIPLQLYASSDKRCIWKFLSKSKATINLIQDRTQTQTQTWRPEHAAFSGNKMTREWNPNNRIILNWGVYIYIYIRIPIAEKKLSTSTRTTTFNNLHFSKIIVHLQ